MLLVTAALSCSREHVSKVKEPTYFLVDMEGDGEVNAQSHRLAVSVGCDLEWSARMLQEDSWVTVKQGLVGEDFSGTLTLEIPLNLEDADRTDTLLVTSGSQVRKVAVTQQRVSSIISTREVLVQGGSAVEVTLNVSDNWEVGSADGEWLTVRPLYGKSGRSTLTLTPADANEDVGSRETDFRIYAGSDIIPVHVVQAQQDAIYVTPDTFTVDYKGGGIQVGTRFNVDYTVETSVDWIVPAATKALHEGAESFTVAAYDGEEPREGQVVFTFGTLKETVTVRQTPMDPVLRNQAPGIYFWPDGRDDLVYSPGRYQLSRLYAGTAGAFRFLDLSEVTVTQVSGIRKDLTEGESLDVTLSINASGDNVFEHRYPVRVLQVEGDYVWLRGEETPGFIIKK